MMTKTKKHAKKTAAHKKARQSRPAGPDYRSTERVKLVAAATLYTELTPHPGDGHKVYVTNISLGGLAFKTRREYEVGASYHIRLDAGPIDMDCPIRIVWVTKRPDGIYEVGTEFVPD